MHYLWWWKLSGISFNGREKTGKDQSQWVLNKILIGKPDTNNTEAESTPKPIREKQGSLWLSPSISRLKPHLHHPVARRGFLLVDLLHTQSQRSFRCCTWNCQGRKASDWPTSDPLVTTQSWVHNSYWWRWVLKMHFVRSVFYWAS